MPELVSTSDLIEVRLEYKNDAGAVRVITDETVTRDGEVIYSERKVALYTSVTAANLRAEVPNGDTYATVMGW